MPPASQERGIRPGENKIKGCEIISAEGFGIFVEMTFDNGYKLCFNEGVNARLILDAPIPKNYQLLIELGDGLDLVFTVAMYGGIILHDGDYDNEYYKKSRQALSPFSTEFEAYYRKLLAESKPNKSAKAFQATEQRFPGIGNGTLQDILFAAGIHPKRKIVTFSDSEKDDLLSSIITVLHDMVENGGRDTEKDILGQLGKYKVNMSNPGMPATCKGVPKLKQTKGTLKTSQITDYSTTVVNSLVTAKSPIKLSNGYADGTYSLVLKAKGKLRTCFIPADLISLCMKGRGEGKCRYWPSNWRKEHFENEVVINRDKKKNQICQAYNMELIRIENSYARRYHHIKEILNNYFSMVH